LLHAGFTNLSDLNAHYVPGLKMAELTTTTESNDLAERGFEPKSFLEAL
jgi:hypothetical protein